MCSSVFQFKEFKCSTFLYMNSNRPGRLSFRLPCILCWGVKGYVVYLQKCIEGIFSVRQQNVVCSYSTIYILCHCNNVLNFETNRIWINIVFFKILIILTGLEQTTYIVIGAGSGVALILLVVLVVICLRFVNIACFYLYIWRWIYILR
jgi:hypothetical protein